MDNQRVFTWAALALVLWLNYLAWQRDYAPAPQLQTQTATPASPAAPNNSSQSLPELPSATNNQAKSTPAPTMTPGAQQPSDAQVIHVRTDVLELDIST